MNNQTFVLLTLQCKQTSWTHWLWAVEQRLVLVTKGVMCLVGRFGGAGRRWHLLAGSLALTCGPGLQSTSPEQKLLT